MHGTASWADAVKVYPVPASAMLHVQVPGSKMFVVTVTNVIGQSVWQGSVQGTAAIAVSRWAKGVYQLALTDAASGEKAVKRVVVE